MACVCGSAAVPERSIARSRLSIPFVVTTMGPGAADPCVHLPGPSGLIGLADELVGVIGIHEPVHGENVRASLTLRQLAADALHAP